MIKHNVGKNPTFLLPLLINISVVMFSLGVGFSVAQSPILIILGVLLFCGIFCLVSHFEATILGLLIVRSSLDIFSAQGIPALFSIVLILMMLTYVVWKLFSRQRIETDKYFWLLLIWVLINGLWVILLPLGGLGMGSSFLPGAMREWTRLFSWVIVYLMVLQLRGKVHPQKIVNLLFISLIVPFAAATLQIFLPETMLPSFLVMAPSYSEIEEASRINGTFGHPNSFASFLVFFVGLACWKVENSQEKRLWLLVLGVLIFFVTSTKALVGLPMTIIVILLFYLPRFTPIKLISAISLVLVTVIAFGSSEYGRERLTSLDQTLLFNPDIDISRSIIMRQFVNNSVNWRVDQWTSLLSAWQDSPILGFGISTVPSLTHLESAAHNDYIRALVEGGIIGFIIFLAFLFFNLLRLVISYLSLPRETPQSDLCMALAAVLVAISVGMISENIFSHTVLFFYWLSLSAIINWDWKISSEMT